MTNEFTLAPKEVQNTVVKMAIIILGSKMNAIQESKFKRSVVDFVFDNRGSEKPIPWDTLKENAFK